MVDFFTPLVAAGISLTEKIIFSWFEEGRSKVKQSQISKEVAELARQEADRRRLREDDLILITERLLQQVIAASPHLIYTKTSFTKEPSVQLAVDVKNPSSSKDLLRDLQSRLALVARNEMELERATASNATAQPHNVMPQQIVESNTAAEETSRQQPAYELYDPQAPTNSRAGLQQGRSEQLLNDLQRRIAAREEGRR